jgi:hypothetical protein
MGPGMFPVLQKSEFAKESAESFSGTPGWKIIDQFDIASTAT